MGNISLNNYSAEQRAHNLEFMISNKQLQHY